MAFAAAAPTFQRPLSQAQVYQKLIQQIAPNIAFSVSTNANGELIFTTDSEAKARQLDTILSQWLASPAQFKARLPYISGGANFVAEQVLEPEELPTETLLPFAIKTLERFIHPEVLERYTQLSVIFNSEKGARVDEAGRCVSKSVNGNAFDAWEALVKEIVAHFSHASLSSIAHTYQNGEHLKQPQEGIPVNATVQEWVNRWFKIVQTNEPSALQKQGHIEFDVAGFMRLLFPPKFRVDRKKLIVNQEHLCSRITQLSAGNGGVLFYPADEGQGVSPILFRDVQPEQNFKPDEGKLCLVVDLSESMKEELDTLKTQLETLCQTIPKKQPQIRYVILITFSDTVTDHGIFDIRTRELNSLLSKIRDLTCEFKTALYGAVGAAYAKVLSPMGRSASSIVLFTDGVNNVDSHVRLEDFESISRLHVKAAGQRNKSANSIPALFAYAYGHASYEILQKITNPFGGYVFPSSQLDNFADTVMDFVPDAVKPAEVVKLTHGSKGNKETHHLRVLGNTGGQAYPQVQIPLSTRIRIGGVRVQAPAQLRVIRTRQGPPTMASRFLGLFSSGAAASGAAAAASGAAAAASGAAAAANPRVAGVRK